MASSLAPGSRSLGSSAPHSSALGGRPFQVEGEPRTAAACERGDWLRQSDLPAAELDAPTRALLGEAWLNDGLMKHASIASFARLTLDLLSLGAPPELVAAAQRASLDAVEHAKLCFSLAARYAEHALGPSGIDIAGAFGPCNLAELAARAVEDGCVGETIARVVAAEQALHATEPRLKRVLHRIADDESRHAELAHQVVRWALDEGGSSVSGAVADAFERGLAAARERAVQRALQAPRGLLEHGRLDPEHLLEALQHACDHEIEPVAETLVSRVSLRLFVCAELRPQSRRPPQFA